MSVPQLVRPAAADRARSWLIPIGVQEEMGPGALTAWPCGLGWDALRVPERVGMAVLAEIGRAGRGPVLSHINHHAFFLISLARRAHAWPPGCRLLTKGDWLAVPTADAELRPIQLARWLHLPDRAGSLTDPDRLCVVVTQYLPNRPSPRASSQLAQTAPLEDSTAPVAVVNNNKTDRVEGDPA